MSTEKQNRHNLEQPETPTEKLPFLAIKIIVSKSGEIYHRVNSSIITVEQKLELKKLKMQGMYSFHSIGFYHRDIIPKGEWYPRCGTNAFAIKANIWVFGKSTDFGLPDSKDWDAIIKYLEQQYPEFTIRPY